MSYCRGNDSDVYAVHDGKYRIYISNDIDHELAGSGISCDEPEDFRDTLIWLSCNGVRVPKRALIRLDYEIKGDFDGWIKYLEDKYNDN